ncbi:serine/threonine protein kinase [Salinibacterium sp. NG253]|uniref:serine protein kinase RIO n=1 Tax=Salinibacterium sp. NG253 TaxID=2792039 RepID=UPI0018CDCEF7|nr:RIO1 family regulatory kinase/ATPase [Salinibacterium sp. NG253]MBH0117502.1 serine/threonine protein kinase [Salinibacterium sp. NG253]
MSHGDDFFVVPDLVFSAVEPGDDQRWSTWPSIIPSLRGPQPWPQWVITSAGAIDTELGVLKSGKEADVFLIERAEPDGHSVLLAAKRYRSSETSDFRRSSQYTEGRRTRRSRDTRALQKKSTYGRALSAGLWAGAEFSALSTLYQLGAPVPYPVQVDNTEVLMEFIGDGHVAAPRLAAVRAEPSTIADLWAQVVELMRVFARAGFAHGDLSPYNLLVHAGRVMVIDVPQIVDIVSNPQGIELLERDCHNVCSWFFRHGVECDPAELAGELVAEAFGR